MLVEKISLVTFAAGILIIMLPEEESLKIIIKDGVRRANKYFIEDDYIGSLKGENVAEKAVIYVGKLLQAAFFMGTRAGIWAFFILSAVMAAGIFLISLNVLPIVPSFFVMAAAGCLPWLLLVGQVQVRRINNSLEGEILVTEILNNYKINYCNMREAVEATALTIEDAPHSKRLLFNLAKGLNKAATDEELKYMTEEFRFAIGTSWADILAANIYLSCQTGMRVTDSLTELAESMRKARDVEEFSKRENNEAFLILKYLVPVSFIVMMAGGIHLFDMSFDDFLEFQFGTRGGITWFVLWILSYIFALAINLLFTKRKFDI